MENFLSKYYQVRVCILSPISNNNLIAGLGYDLDWNASEAVDVYCDR